MLNGGYVAYLKRGLMFVGVVASSSLIGCGGTHSSGTSIPNVSASVAAVQTTTPAPGTNQPTSPNVTSDGVAAALPGSGASPSEPTGSSGSPVQVRLNYVLPSINMKNFRETKSDNRGTRYISSSNARITVGVTPLGGSTTNFGPTSCTTSACPVSFTTVPGPTTLILTLSDSGGTVLSSFSIVKIIQPQTLNTLNFSSNPVAASASLSLGSTSVNGGTPTKVPLTLNVLDADGNVIVGNSPYIDSNGNHVTFSLSVNNNQAGGRGTVVIQGPTLITAPGQTAMSAMYDGNWLASSTISIASSSTAISSLTDTTLSTIPTAYENMQTGLNNPYAIIAGADGAVWFANANGNSVGRLTLTGANASYPAGLNPNSIPTRSRRGPMEISTSATSTVIQSKATTRAARVRRSRR
jgi:hypothetical protein